MVCTGAGVEEDATGRISLSICGERPEEAWSLPCAVSSHNPLRTDESGCLWIAPFGRPTVVRGTASSIAPGSAVVGTPITVTNLLSLMVSNVDPCRPADALIEIVTDYEGTPTAGADYTFSRQILGVDNPDAGMLNLFRDESPAANVRKSTGLGIRVRTGIAAGGSFLLTVSVQVSVNAGTFAVSVINVDALVSVVVPEP